MTTDKKPEMITVDKYVPDYKTGCRNCGEKPTVTAVKDGKRIAHFHMCGPCMFGDSDCIDPENW
jgi:hypothetical protein